MTKTVNAASVAIFDGQKVLLVQRALPPYALFWTLPGGRMEEGETIEACAIREVQEELGIVLETLVPVTHSSGGAHYHLAVFAAAISAATPQPSSEIADWGWQAPDALDHLQTTPGLAEILILAQQKLSQA